MKRWRILDNNFHFIYIANKTLQSNVWLIRNVSLQLLKLTRNGLVHIWVKIRISISSARWKLELGQSWIGLLFFYLSCFETYKLSFIMSPYSQIFWQKLNRMGLMVYETRNFFLVCFTVLKWRHVCSHDLRTPLLFLFLCSCINRNILNLCHLLWEFEFLININFVFVLHVYNFCTRIFELKKKLWVSKDPLCVWNISVNVLCCIQSL